MWVSLDSYTAATLHRRLSRSYCVDDPSPPPTADGLNLASRCCLRFAITRECRSRSRQAGRRAGAQNHAEPPRLSARAHSCRPNSTFSLCFRHYWRHTPLAVLALSGAHTWSNWSLRMIHRARSRIQPTSSPHAPCYEERAYRCKRGIARLRQFLPFPSNVLVWRETVRRLFVQFQWSIGLTKRRLQAGFPASPSTHKSPRASRQKNKTSLVPFLDPERRDGLHCKSPMDGPHPSVV
jgi:hypothetical protein